MTPPLGLIDMFSMGGIPGVRAIATALPTSTVAMRRLAGLSSRGRCGSPSLILSIAVTSRLRLICGASSRTCSQDIVVDRGKTEQGCFVCTSQWLLYLCGVLGADNEWNASMWAWFWAGMADSLQLMRGKSATALCQNHAGLLEGVHNCEYKVCTCVGRVTCACLLEVSTVSEDKQPTRIISR